MFFQKKDANDILLNEFWLEEGDFRGDEMISEMKGYYVLPGGYEGLTVSSKRTEAWAAFHEIVLSAIENIAQGYAVALMVQDYEQQGKRESRERINLLKNLACSQSKFYLKEETDSGENLLFIYNQLPKQVYKELYQYINMDFPHESIYLICSILKNLPERIDSIQEIKKSALLNWYIDEAHLVLRFQAAPQFPLQKIKAAIKNGCDSREWRFFDQTKSSV